MHEILKLQQKIVPELMELLEKRYDILRTIKYNQPIGRRILANKIGIGERVVRTEISFLKKQNLINISNPGMSVTKDGEEIIDKLKNFIKEFKGLTEIEEIIKEKLNIKKVIIVPGDIDEDSTVMNEIGRTAAKFIQSIILDGDIVAISGGTTMKSLVDNYSYSPRYQNTVVVPARGGMERNLQTEANTLAANFADKLGASYKLIHVPDNLSNEALSTIINEKSIKNAIDTIRKADIIIYGVGRADEMSSKRGLSDEEISHILGNGSVAEAFGYYFDKEGNVVYHTPSLGLKTEDIRKAKNIVAVAGSKSKAEAIVATQISGSKRSVLITDEGTSKEIMRILKVTN
ncbi:sugar-binding transcriptional regulator [Clostridium felsineum]|uniref:Central glycolytic genes regulator n=1 Tax=Clostridium felsineum TaxID=36839 RepID=A0A1S8LCS0_9CLOT|nr:sugar-binding transcriptional regulator [Clostridium felsineum]MCR3759375.1 sugar-binding transcriptional regulator [Clostridium felsineum]URZ01717.1 Central glycolytic genes regulator [Clostridium felsineum]URZ05425.1 Central glycolytic genes regulator [Clostridium felsineum]URZ10466.1 Central glycolytic genes regulator [Clostridium felsineum]URZ17607.1 Central glycolytic genes regulator [Clostridium felsineum DSM 794]